MMDGFFSLIEKHLFPLLGHIRGLNINIEIDHSKLVCLRLFI